MICLKYEIVAACLLISCIMPVYEALPQNGAVSPAQSNEMALRLARISMRPENNARHNELQDASHDSMYPNMEQFRYEQKPEQLPSFQGPLNVLEDGANGQERQVKNGKIEKTDRSLVGSMLGLMGGLLKSHLRDDSHYTQFQ